MFLKEATITHKNKTQTKQTKQKARQHAQNMPNNTQGNEHNTQKCNNANTHTHAKKGRTIGKGTNTTINNQNDKRHTKEPITQKKAQEQRPEHYERKRTQHTKNKTQTKQPKYTKATTRTDTPKGNTR